MLLLCCCSKMAEDGEIDIEGDFDFKIDHGNDIYDANELPSKSANLLPEYTSPAWMLEQGWTMDSCMDEKSKATIEKMLQEEQYYINGKGKGRVVRAGTFRKTSTKQQSHKQPWTEEEKLIFQRGLEVFGRSWTKIAEILPNRTVLQVKNYAQQYFKQKAKLENDGEDSCSSNTSLAQDVPKPAVATHSAAELSSSQTESVSKSDASTKLTSRSAKKSPLPKTETSMQNDSKSDPLSEVIKSVTTAQPTVSTLRPSSASVSMTLTQSIGQLSNSALLAHLRSQVQSKSISNKSSEDRGNLGGEAKPSVDTKVHNSKSQKNTAVVTKSMKTQSKKDQKAQKLESMELPTTPKKQTLEVATDTKKLQLSPTLENKLATSTGIIENLDRFCAVADIITEGVDTEDDEEIDIENDDDIEKNPVLQNRSASPNSVYEKLLKAANASKRIPAKKQQTQTTGQLVQKLLNGSVSESAQSVCEDEVHSQVEAHEETQAHMADDDDGATQDSETGSEEDLSTEHSDEAVHSSKPNNAIALQSGEMVEFPVPTEERSLQAKEITEEERRIHAEFFDGRPSKTPERYLRIRNYIMDCWRKCRPNYLNKTSVRPGLKNCGDVNVIGRIHSFLECTGVINFGCDQSCYKNPRPILSGPRDRLPKDDVQISTAKLDSMRPRKRRIRDAYGHWIDEKEAQGKTIEHKEGVIEAEIPVKQKVSRKMNYDPFKLVQCQNFTEDKKAPFLVNVHNTALVVMDVHAHISKTEVIGLLGGVYNSTTHRLDVHMAVPCNSLSTGMQCEMDPVSQTEACEKIMYKELSVIGWYHSHPAFAPNPSVRDIETQLKFQDWFSKGGFTYIGIIVSPYDRLNSSMVSEFRCLTISEDKHPTDMCNIPYRFDHEVTLHSLDETDIISQARAIAEKYSTYPHRVDLLGMYRASGQTCLGKMIESIRSHLLPLCEQTDYILNSIHEVFSLTFGGNNQDLIDPEIVYEEEINSMEITSSDLDTSMEENLELGVSVSENSGLNGNGEVISTEPDKSNCMIPENHCNSIMEKYILSS